MHLFYAGFLVFAIIILQNFVFKFIWKTKLSYTINFSAKEAFEGDEIYLIEQLQNMKHFAIPYTYIRTVLPLGIENNDNTFLQSLFYIGSYKTITKRRKIECKKRGLYKLRYSCLVSYNWLFTKKYFYDVPLIDGLTVFPKLLDELDDIKISLQNLESIVLSQKLLNPDPFEFYALREYVPTDTFKSINFKASAISQKLMVNVHHPTSNLKIKLILNINSINENNTAETTEYAIQICATIANYFAGLGASIGLISNGRDERTLEPIYLYNGSSEGHLIKIFECLARLNIYLKPCMIDTFFDAYNDFDNFYIFVSPSKEEKFIDYYNEIISSGTSAVLITPSIENPNQFCYN